MAGLPSPPPEPDRSRLTAIPDRFVVRETLADNHLESLYVAYDQKLDREVVLKLAAGVSPARGVDRSLREARMLARVQSQGVVRLYEVIETPSGSLLVLEPIVGETLADLLAREGPLPQDRVIAIGRELCEALSAVHAEGVVHRAIAASNVIVKPDGSLCLSGFVLAKPAGIANLSSIDYRATEPTRAPGTLVAYPSPEQIAGQPADARSDIYALGCVLHQLLTGRPPEGPAADPRIAAPRVRSKLAEVVRTATARTPRGRFSTARALADALAACEPTKAQIDPRLVGLAAVAAAACALVAVLFLVLRQPPVPSSVIQETRPPASTGPFSPLYTASRALVIGIGNAYAGTGKSVLPRAEQDAEELASTLRSQGWDVTALVGRDRTTRLAIRGALDAMRTVGPDDRLLVFYAGHGERQDSGTSLIPSSGDPRDRIEFSELRNFLVATRAKHVLLVLDCCYSGGLHDELFRGEPFGDAPVGPADLRRRAHTVITSCAADEVTPDRSMFFTGMLEALRTKYQAQRELTAMDLTSAIRAHMTQNQATRFPEYQTVRYRDNLDGGQFLLVLGRAQGTSIESPPGTK